jgi:N-acyl-D-aspartate/D-glutamate deacylase
MRREVRSAMHDGALGFSINRNPRHMREDGTPLPSSFADDNEIQELAMEVGRQNVGIIQTIGATTEPSHLRWYGEIGLMTRRPVIWQSIRHRSTDPDGWRAVLDAASAEADRGARLFGLSTTRLESGAGQTDPEAIAQILNSPLQLIGISDAGAHATSGSPHFGYATRLLGLWVRERQIMSLEEAIYGLTFAVANVYDLPDRGLLRAGYKADLVLFDANRIQPELPEWVDDLPAGQGRYIERSQGIEMTIVNGVPLIEHDQHTGALPGQTLRNRLAARTRRRATIAA